MITFSITRNLHDASETVNNLLSPVVALVSIVFIFMTFNATLKSNELQRASNLMGSLPREMQIIDDKYKALVTDYQSADIEYGRRKYSGYFCFEQILINRNFEERYADAFDEMYRLLKWYNNILDEFKIFLDKYKEINEIEINHKVKEISALYRDELHQFVALDENMLKGLSTKRIAEFPVLHTNIDNLLTEFETLRQ